MLYNWDTRALEVVFEALDPATMAFSLTAPTARHIGGQLDLRPGEPLSLRLLLDYSVLEVFTGSGQALATLLPGPEGQLTVEAGGANPELSTSSGQVAAVEGGDLRAGAAIVHLIDTVLLPEGTNFTATAAA